MQEVHDLHDVEELCKRDEGCKVDGPDITTESIRGETVRIHDSAGEGRDEGDVEEVVVQAKGGGREAHTEKEA